MWEMLGFFIAVIGLMVTLLIERKNIVSSFHELSNEIKAAREKSQTAETAIVSPDNKEGGFTKVLEWLKSAIAVAGSALVFFFDSIMLSLSTQSPVEMPTEQSSATHFIAAMFGLLFGILYLRKRPWWAVIAVLLILFFGVAIYSFTSFTSNY